MEERDRLRVAQAWGVSPKRFAGWEPSWETVYEYDDAGRLVRSVTRQVEPEWDSHWANRVLGLDQHDQDCCPGCGLHKSVLDDPDNHQFEFPERTCGVCAGKDLKLRILREGDEEFDKKHPNKPARDRRPYDGRHVGMREVHPLERLAREARRG